MVHHRERFERVYAPTEAVAPPSLLEEASDEETDDFMRRKHVAFEGISPLTGSYALYHRGERQAVVAWRDKAVRDGVLIEIEVDGWRGMRWALAGDAGDIATVDRGKVPQAWRPLAETATEETTFLSPLDPVSARKRAAVLFDFDYIWEVYTPAPKRKFGYYALPVLWGDRLVARFDGRLERSTSTFAILGVWLEDEALASDPAFAEAFACGIERMGRLLGAERLDVTGVPQRRFRERLGATRP
jgi:uncharacterized protein YcaQ